MRVTARRYLRQTAYRGFEFKRWGFLLVIASTIAGEQGLYELYDKDRGLLESLRQANWTWFLACLITIIGILLTSEFLWKLVHGPRAAEARIMASLRMVALACNLGEVANVRAAVFVAHRRGNERVLFQEFPYVYAHFQEGDYGLGEYGISESIGIVGHLLRNEDESLCVFIENTDDDKFRHGLVKPPWNFPKALAYKVDRQRANYMGIRFVRSTPAGGSIEGVLYFDARGERQVFTNSTLEAILKEQVDAIVDSVADYFRKG